MTEPINQFDAQGRWYGVWEAYWANGTLMWRRHYLHGKLHGLSVNYYESGTLSWRRHHHHGKEHGLWVWYDIHGTAEDKLYCLNIK
jgi:antitoxin component YwqK of YwqJK toxin-antitoxin module